MFAFLNGYPVLGIIETDQCSNAVLLQVPVKTTARFIHFKSIGSLFHPIADVRTVTHDREKVLKTY